MEKLRKISGDVAAIVQSIVEKAGWRLVAGLTLSVVTLISFGIVADSVFEGELDRFDSGIRAFYQMFASPVVTSAMIFFTYLGSVYGIVGLLALVVIYLFLKGEKRAAALLTITMSGEAILGIVLKLSFQRPRPQAFFGFSPPDSYSFPSGHAFASLCFFGVLGWISASHLKSNVSVAVSWLFAGLIIFAIGSSRIYLGVHYPSDILAGYLAGIVWLSAVYAADHKLQARTKT